MYIAYLITYLIFQNACKSINLAYMEAKRIIMSLIQVSEPSVRY